MAKVQRMSEPPATSNGPHMETGTDARMPAVTITQPAGLASEKQVHFAKSLLKKHDYPAIPNLDSWGKHEMTALIDSLKNGTYRPADDTEEQPF